jgi:hypothetical protein
MHYIGIEWRPLFSHKVVRDGGPYIAIVMVWGGCPYTSILWSGVEAHI